MEYHREGSSDVSRKKEEEANAKYKATINKHRRHKVFQVGAMVMVFAQGKFSCWNL